MRVPGDLFEPRPVPVCIRPIVREQRQRSGPSDDDLRALAAAGLSLRRIAERVGLSHEAIRRRLDTTAPDGRHFCPPSSDPSAIVVARKAVGSVALPEPREHANGESPGGGRRSAR